MNFKIFDGRGSFYQWDLNQKLIVDGITLNDEIHFKNIDGVNALVVKPYSSGENILVDVPNILLQKANSITVWVYVNNDHTKEQAVFNVIPRQKPADYIYTPTEVSVWKVLEEAVENIPNEYAKKNHVHSQYLTAETDPSVGDWAKKGSEYEITGNPVTLENIEHMPMKVVTTLEPVQSGSGDPSPSNIRPISGWTGAKLTRCGKNLLPDIRISSGGFTSVGNGVFKYVSNNNTTISTFLFKAGITYTISATAVSGTGYKPCIIVRNPTGDRDGQKTNYGATGNPLTFSFDADTNFDIILQAETGNGLTTVNDSWAIQLELGSTATTYEPYQGDTYTADFGQTVYGGTLDWQTGALTVDKAFVEYDGSADENWARQVTNTSGYASFRIALSNVEPNTNPSNVPYVVSNMYVAKSPNSVYLRNNGFCINQSDVNVYDDAKATLSADEWKAWLAGNPLQVVYKLATPTTIQLTPHEIEALQGTNTLYGDGSLTVSGSKDVYWMSKNLLERIKTLESAIISLGGNV